MHPVTSIHHSKAKSTHHNRNVQRQHKTDNSDNQVQIEHTLLLLRKLVGRHGKEWSTIPFFIPVGTESPKEPSIRFMHVVKQRPSKSRFNEQESRNRGNKEKDHRRHQNAALELAHPFLTRNCLT